METEQLIGLWKTAVSRGEQLFLATVVHVQGSSYRRPGARMLVSSSGERAGTISGGCLEAEITRKIAWLTRDGSTLEQYHSSFDDETDDTAAVAYGLGCNGTIWILMESGEVVHEVMRSLVLAWEQGTSSVIVCTLEGDRPRSVVVHERDLDAADVHGIALAERALRESRVVVLEEGTGRQPQCVCLPIVPPPHLHIFGAGDDAQPIARIAAELGWKISVADGRAHLLRPERFPNVHSLRPLQYNTPAQGQRRALLSPTGVADGDCAVILTHSYEQDEAILEALLRQSTRYLGILGPLHRTRRILQNISGGLRLSVEECLGRLHAPIGLRIGSGAPGLIALSVIAEIQATLAGVHVLVSTQPASGSNLPASASQSSSVSRSNTPSGNATTPASCRYA